jgi:hypothetical protein
MDDLRETLDRGAREYEPPSAGWDLVHRRARARSLRRKLAVVTTSMLISVAGVLFVAEGFRGPAKGTGSTGESPLEGPRVTPWFHPGETDPIRSDEATRAVGRCAREAGWELQRLELLVDHDGLLIRIAYRAYRAQTGVPGAAAERQVVEVCLGKAEVTSPPGWVDMDK